jgi:hypothetical protein
VGTAAAPVLHGCTSVSIPVKSQPRMQPAALATATGRIILARNLSQLWRHTDIYSRPGDRGRPRRGQRTQHFGYFVQCAIVLFHFYKFIILLSFCMCRFVYYFRQ